MAAETAKKNIRNKILLSEQLVLYYSLRVNPAKKTSNPVSPMNDK